MSFLYFIWLKKRPGHLTRWWLLGARERDTMGCSRPIGSTLPLKHYSCPRYFCTSKTKDGFLKEILGEGSTPAGTPHAGPALAVFGPWHFPVRTPFIRRKNACSPVLLEEVGWRSSTGKKLLEGSQMPRSCLWVRIRMCYRTPVHPTGSCLGFSKGSVISLCTWIRDWVRKENTNDDFSLSAVVLRPRKAYWPFTDTEAHWSCHSRLGSLMLMRVLLAFSAMKTTKINEKVPRSRGSRY